jgi:N-acetylglucosaminyldiphosphoundecaprenol N-acetyl-beta-D-mannosaminyltransferase
MITETLEDQISSHDVIGFPVHALKFDTQIQLMIQWAKQHLSKVVCIANVHMLVEAHNNPAFGAVLKGADLVSPDGMPLVWMLRYLGSADQDRVAGLDVLMGLCEMASQETISVFFLGSEKSVLDRMRSRLTSDFPSLRVAGMEPLPFRPLTAEEDEQIVRHINESGAGLVLVCLGCPKQEFWMSEHKHRIHAVMVGLGGAFPVYAGIHKRAPRLIRVAGFEWLFRLVQEPGRLWKRYSVTIPPFLWLSCKQLILREVSHLKGSSWEAQGEPCDKTLVAGSDRRVID